jgi:hypothetical protein
VLFEQGFLDRQIGCGIALGLVRDFDVDPGDGKIVCRDIPKPVVVTMAVPSERRRVFIPLVLRIAAIAEFRLPIRCSATGNWSVRFPSADWLAVCSLRDRKSAQEERTTGHMPIFDSIGLQFASADRRSPKII